ncbi:MAG TPA: helix-turn-helix domain-containing protein [Pseudonocardiaceae bacterium]|nr:helix-turn-helix domain-containing protein [Pseudonocardiaceae bacterium]
MTQPGRRERKKAQTRTALADAAMRLFTERGYDEVTVTEVAEAADVSVTTLFKHFPGGKESLVFDQDTSQQEALVAAVRDRGAEQSILDALRTHLKSLHDYSPVERALLEQLNGLVRRSKSLTEYADRMWLRHEKALAEAIAIEVGVDVRDVKAQALARYAIDAHTVAEREDDPRQAIDTIFDLLTSGWGDYGKVAAGG